MDRKNLFKNSAAVKLAATAVALTLIAAASLIPAKSEPVQLTDPNLLNQDPIVMELAEKADAIVEEETAEEEEKKQKLGFFTRLKLAFYAFCAAAGAWIAHKIPWRKIFNKRNAVIVLVLAVVLLLAYHAGIPMLESQMNTAN